MNADRRPGVGAPDYEKYMIIRRKFEEYMDDMAGKNTVE